MAILVFLVLLLVVVCKSLQVAIIYYSIDFNRGWMLMMMMMMKMKRARNIIWIQSYRAYLGKMIYGVSFLFLSIYFFFFQDRIESFHFISFRFKLFLSLCFFSLFISLSLYSSSLKISKLFLNNTNNNSHSTQ